ncbi:MAG TPA: serine hydrolase, partial [Salinimicrobium sp.]|nr:serine hydrolase [Salinimicrobium sp.]
MKKHFLLVLCFIGLMGCSTDDNSGEIPSEDTEMYFPPIGSGEWETKTPQDLGWNTETIPELENYLSQNGTRAFLILKNGKIVMEKYWGNNIANTETFDKNTNWYWASAGKTLTAFLVGIAQEEGILNINDRSSDYLGENWSSLDLNKENEILLKHHLTMTTGLDYNVPNIDCTDPECLQFGVEVGTQWYYHNAAYTLLEQVVSNASGMDFNDFTDLKIQDKIGMNGSWIYLDYNRVYWSSARDAARFGLLLLNEGIWNETPVLADANYFNEMINSSQDINPSYGYLTWLNGKSEIMVPGFSNSFNTPLSENAPTDLYAAMGKNGQFINVVPSKNLVVIRMGEAPGEDLVPIEFHNEMW